MGAQDSRVAFRKQVLNLCQGSNTNEQGHNDEGLINSLLSDYEINTYDDFYALFSVQDARLLRTNSPTRFIQLLQYTIDQFLEISSTGEFVYDRKAKQKLMQCIRLMTRLFPLLYEASDTMERDEYSLLWAHIVNGTPGEHRNDSSRAGSLGPSEKSNAKASHQKYKVDLTKIPHFANWENCHPFAKSCQEQEWDATKESSHDSFPEENNSNSQIDAVSASPEDSRLGRFAQKLKPSRKASVIRKPNISPSGNRSTSQTSSRSTLNDEGENLQNELPRQDECCEPGCSSHHLSNDRDKANAIPYIEFPKNCRGVLVIDRLIELLFTLHFTVESRSQVPQNRHHVLWAIWELGIGCAATMPSVAEHETNRVEILRCILAMTCRNIYVNIGQQESSPSLALMYISSSLSKQKILCLLCSLLNTVLKHYAPTKSHSLSLLNISNTNPPNSYLPTPQSKNTILYYLCLHTLLAILTYTVPTNSAAQRINVDMPNKENDDENTTSSTSLNSNISSFYIKALPLNQFHVYISKLHRPVDMNLILDHLYRLLARNFEYNWLATNRGEYSECELLMLLLKICQFNPRLVNHLLHEKPKLLLQYLVFIFAFAIENCMDRTMIDMVRVCMFFLQPFTADPYFCKLLNTAFVSQHSFNVSSLFGTNTSRSNNTHKANSPKRTEGKAETHSINNESSNNAQLDSDFDQPCLAACNSACKALGMPASQIPTFFDFFVIAIYHLMARTNGLLSSLYPTLVVMISNITPYMNDIARDTATKWMVIFSSLSAPSFLTRSKQSPQLLIYLCESISIVLSSDTWKKNPNFVLALINSSRTFSKLSKLTFADLVSPRNKTQFALASSSEEESETDDLEEETVICPAPTSPAPPQQATKLSAASRLKRTISRSDSKDSSNLQLQLNTPPMFESPYNQIHQQTGRQPYKIMSEKSQGKLPESEALRKNSSSSAMGALHRRQSSLMFLHFQQHQQNQIDKPSTNAKLSVVQAPPLCEFNLCQEWMNSWFLKLDIGEIYIIIKNMKKEARKYESLSSQEESEALMTDLENVSKKKLAHRSTNAKLFHWSRQATVWFQSLVWGYLYIAETRPVQGSVKVWADTNVKLFKVREKRGASAAAENAAFNLARPKGALDTVARVVLDKFETMNTNQNASSINRGTQNTERK